MRSASPASVSGRVTRPDSTSSGETAFDLLQHRLDWEGWRAALRPRDHQSGYFDLRESLLRVSPYEPPAGVVAVALEHPVEEGVSPARRVGASVRMGRPVSVGVGFVWEPLEVSQ